MSSKNEDNINETGQAKINMSTTKPARLITQKNWKEIDNKRRNKKRWGWVILKEPQTQTLDIQNNNSMEDEALRMTNLLKVENMQLLTPHPPKKDYWSTNKLNFFRKIGI